MCARPFPAAFPQQVSSIFIMNSLLINCRLFKINSYNLTECWCLCVLSPPALDVRPLWSLGWGRWWGAISVPSRNSLKDVAHPCLAVVVLHPLWWSPWVSVQAQLSISLLCPGKKQRAGAGGCSDTGAARPGLVSLLPFIDPQPSTHRRREGEQLLPLHGWEGQETGQGHR